MGEADKSVGKSGGAVETGKRRRESRVSAERVISTG